VATSTLSQTVDLSGAASAIDAGAVPYELSADLGGALIDPSAASVTVNFLNASKVSLGTGQLAPVTAFDRLFQTELLERDTTGTIPVGARSAQVTAPMVARSWQRIRVAGARKQLDPSGRGVARQWVGASPTCLASGLITFVV